ncbi:PREDICTED: exocyst complex component 3-like protein 2, partial [Corvus brachyrhynchos]|uniref:exocyst complex component 3-like protein 2 n=1 Tax=Corvus brachyrhynchos TaxID=85066 RepID=UPI0008165A95
MVAVSPQLLRAHVDRAPQVTPEFGREMAHSLLGVLVAFLHSFQRKVERFLEAPSEVPPTDSAPGRAIALANCCPPFRAFAERLAQFGHPESEEPRRQAHAALDRVTPALGATGGAGNGHWENWFRGLRVLGSTGRAGIRNWEHREHWEHREA